MSKLPAYSDVLEYWFAGAADNDPLLKSRMPTWFGSSTEIDAEIRDRFLPAVEAATAGELSAWVPAPKKRLALILLLDQFTRNCYRGTRRAFAADDLALDLTLTGIELAMHEDLGPAEQVFFLMPLQHAESLQIQEKSVQQFEDLLHRLPEIRQPHFRGFVEYARLHFDIVKRFGRFPHRNGILGRTDTPEEKEYLSKDAPRFGQR